MDQVTDQDHPLHRQYARIVVVLSLLLQSLLSGGCVIFSAGSMNQRCEFQPPFPLKDEGGSLTRVINQG
ncbi:hypothetical protein CQ019_07990 [Arthrobacter sp. MYb229]|nr:hypothetical protein CQ019_07990 [Arthrobacter sp. MYb229]PRB51820.1 hypothetical protein CQ013_08590 [Arthrobacter sp. MYb216]